MSTKNSRSPSRQELLAEVEDLRTRLAEAQDHLRAIRKGDKARDEREVEVQERTEAESRLACLASFPLRNPNPVLEVDLNGKIRYMNPAAMRLFPDLGAQGSRHPWLKDWAAVKTRFHKGQTETALRDLTLGDRTWQQAFYYSAENRFVRIYGFDITDRKRAEQALQGAHERLQAQTEELRTANEELQAQQEELQSQAQELRETEQALRRLNEELEQRVAARTAELSKASEAVRAERQRFNDVLETLPAYLVLLTPDHHVSFANRFFRERFGESHGQRCFEYLFHRTEPCEVCETYKVLQTRKPLEWEWTGPDGRNYNIYDFPFTDADGSTLIMEVGLDITERKRAENALMEVNETLEQRVAERTQALQAAHHKIGSILETMSDCFVTFDRDWRYTYVNAAAAKAFHMPPEQLLGKTIWELWPAAHDLPLGVNLRRALQEHISLQFEQFYPEPLNRWFECRCYPTPEGLATFFNDITERKQAEQRLTKMNREIALANRILQVFVEETGDDLFDKALQIVLEGMESRHGVFGYLDENGDLVCPSMSKLLGECEVADKCTRYARDRWKGLWSQALLEKQTLFTNEPAKVPKGHVPIRNNLAAPIVLRNRVIGLLNVANKKTDYTEADRELIEAMAQRIAPVLYAWIQRELRESERQRTEQALAESEQRLRLALAGGRMGLWEWDVQSDASTWDQRVYELLGLETGVSGTRATFFRCVDHRDRDSLQKIFTQAQADQESFQAEFRVVHPSGEILWLALRGQVLRVGRGPAVQMIGVLYDITVGKQMEEQLRRLNDQLEEEVQAQTEELRDAVDRLQDEVVRRVLAEGKLRKHSQMLEAFFQHTITPLAFLDKYFNFVRVNEAYAKAAGKDPEYFAGRNHFALYPHAENRALFEQVVRTRQPHRAYAEPLSYLARVEQRATWWNWQLTPLLDDHGQVQFLVFNLQDVTDRQRAFQELEQRARQLQELTLELSEAEDRERKRLAEILHDDLQQQLAAAKFHLGILSSRLKSEPSLQEIAGQLNQMMKDAIEKSRSLSHELSPAVLYQSDLGETFEWLARQMQTKHGLTVHVEVRGRVDPSSEALKAFLYKTAQELLFNVVKHARTKETRLRLQRMRGQLWLTIGDRGQGFDPHTLSKTHGFGLLSIRERVELLGGRMKIRSARGRGSTFLIVVPDSPMPSVARLPETSGEETGVEAAGQKKVASLRVLLADDHEVMREGLATLLNEQQDIEIVGQAGNGREAVDLAYKLQPDVIIMDASMPVMAGEEATRQIKLHLPGTRVVALSMSHEAEMADRMRRAGAETYLLKTGPSEELLAAIRGQRKE